MQICWIVGVIFIPNAAPRSNRGASRQPTHVVSSSDTPVLCWQATTVLFRCRLSEACSGWSIEAMSPESNTRIEYRHVELVTSVLQMNQNV
jgi:hypothetical protein